MSLGSRLKKSDTSCAASRLMARVLGYKNKAWEMVLSHCCFSLGMLTSMVCTERIFLVLLIIGSRAAPEVSILSPFCGAGVKSPPIVGERQDTRLPIWIATICLCYSCKHNPKGISKQSCINLPPEAAYLHPKWETELLLQMQMMIWFISVKMYYSGCRVLFPLLISFVTTSATMPQYPHF